MLSDLPGTPPGDDLVLGIAALNRLVRARLEQAFPLLWVAGEISNLAVATSGHVYFALKDEVAQVRCVMFRNRAQLLPLRLRNGMQVEARVLVTLYEPRGDFQLNVEALRHAGIGALYEAFARLRERLEREGVFDSARKCALPRFPSRVGVITSLQAAALQDVRAALRRRSPSLSLVIYPAAVQGEGAAQQIADALDAAAQRAECGVLILARGGGGIEDLWAFNEEIVARAILRCAIPVVTGIGHETDTTIADLAADQRATTPTAAAELVSEGYFEAARHLAALRRALDNAAQRELRARMQRVDRLARGLAHPGERLRGLAQRVAHAATRMVSAARRNHTGDAHRLAQLALRLHAARPRLELAHQVVDTLAARIRAGSRHGLKLRCDSLVALGAHLEHLSPSATLQRGYAVARDRRGTVVRSSAALAAGDELRVQFAEGWADTLVRRSG